VLRDGSALQIFDMTTGTLVGSCSEGTQCAVGYSADAGVHRFQAIVSAAPSDAMPPTSSVASDAISVGWIGVSLATTQTALGPGKSATLTAASTVPVEQFGYSIQLLEGDGMTPITFCSRGTKCSMSVTKSSSGSRAFAASVGPATSNHVSVTWLSVALAGSPAYRVGGTVHLVATANADLTHTPWSIGILDERGHPVAPPCTAATTCSADVTVTSTTPPVFTAVVGAIPPARDQSKLVQLVQKVSGPIALANIQAQSAPFQPARLLWGVDSCKAMTGDPSGDEVFPTIVGGMGTPEFWGRYLTDTVCPGITSAEVALAAKYHIGILPIYNDYDCSNVVYYQTGHDYATAAVDAARRLGIPKGRVLAIDIEPYGADCPGAGSVDSGFIEGWFDGITGAGYVPVYYGNGTEGSEFANAWCEAVSALPNIAKGSDLWSFEPSLIGDYSKDVAPGYGPYSTGCPSNIEAWQYLLGSNGPDGDVDQDEALFSLALWYPS
jgi:glycoside hydrolase-like protein